MKGAMQLIPYVAEHYIPKKKQRSCRNCLYSLDAAIRMCFNEGSPYYHEMIESDDTCRGWHSDEEPED